MTVTECLEIWGVPFIPNHAKCARCDEFYRDHYIKSIHLEEALDGNSGIENACPLMCDGIINGWSAYKVFVPKRPNRYHL